MLILEESILTRFDVRGNPENNPAEGTIYIARKARMNPQLKKGVMTCRTEGRTGKDLLPNSQVLL